MKFIVRPAEAADAENIGRLAGEFIEYLRGLGDRAVQRFDAAAYLRDGFGDDPAFAGIVAEEAGEIFGYLLYYFGYDTDSAARTLHVVDLFVTEKRRRHGIGQILMERAMEICRAAGGKQLLWAVYVHNKAAIGFFERIGGRYTFDMIFMRLDL